LQRIIFNLINVSAFILLVYSCANIGAPVGGAKDTKPPVVVETDPPDRSVNFKAQKKIIITFDEFIALKDIYQELVVSPPLKENVIAYIRNKSLVIDFPKDVVFDTTTYTLSFGNSIADNNEGNILPNYEFVFSLKSYIDSLSVDGKVISSFDLLPDKDPMFVMLYKNLADSAPLIEKPKYISRTDKQGNFTIHNIEPGFYRIFGLKDANSNLMFDLPDEQIAFGDSIIELTAKKLGIDTVTVKDTSAIRVPVKNKSNEKEFKLTATPLKDTTRADTVLNIRKYISNQELRFFTQKVKNQYMTNNLRLQPELLFFSFYQSLLDTFKIRPLYIPFADNWYISDINKTEDTLKYWLTDTTMISKDSLQFEVSFPVYDSAGEIISKKDTLLLLFRPKENHASAGTKKPRQRHQVKTDSIPKLVKKIELTDNVANSSAFDLDQSLNFRLSKPLKELRKEKIKISRFEDTLAFDVKPIISSGNTLYNFTIDFKPEENTSYKLLIPDSTIFDIYGATNDTTLISFKTQAEDFYGTLSMRMNNISSPVILQLMDEKENLVRENRLSESQTIKYKYLVPKAYILKLIIDSNNNGKWDTGNYLMKLQPEKVLYYTQRVNVRSNWEIELTWDVKY
jgi:hypothetical protein